MWLEKCLIGMKLLEKATDQEVTVAEVVEEEEDNQFNVIFVKGSGMVCRGGN